MKQVFIVAGEASADFYGARLVNKLRERIPDALFYGVGGGHLRRAGLHVLIDAQEFSLVGISEWLGRAPSIVANYRRVVRAVCRQTWDLAILIDLPDINLRLAKHFKSAGTPVCYYVSPQVWAWRKGRVRQIQSRVSKMLVIYPFEEEFYRQRGVDARFVGHPLVECIAQRPRFDFQARPVQIAILPGSRMSEIHYHAAALCDTMWQLQKKYHVNFTIPLAGTLEEGAVRRAFASAPPFTISFDARTTLAGAHCALIGSGTATLEAALIGVPFCIFYRVAWLSKCLFEWLVDVPFIGMPNILAKREIVKEFFQDAFTKENMVNECERLLENESYRDAMIASFTICRQALGSSGRIASAADEIAPLLHESLHSFPPSKTSA